MYGFNEERCQDADQHELQGKFDTGLPDRVVEKGRVTIAQLFHHRHADAALFGDLDHLLQLMRSDPPVVQGGHHRDREKADLQFPADAEADEPVRNSGKHEESPKVVVLGGLRNLMAY